LVLACANAAISASWSIPDFIIMSPCCLVIACAGRR
jgi:hypothetical protein